MSSISRGPESMTGYAVVEADLGVGRTVQLHAKSVNHRFFEFRWRAPREWVAHEVSVRQVFQSTLKRGSLDVWVDDGASTGREGGVEALFRALAEALERSRLYSGLPDERRLDVLLKRPEAWQSRTENAVEASALVEAFSRLATQLKSVRCAEGEALAVALRAHHARLQELVESLTAEATKLISTWQTETRQRLETLAAELNMAPPAQERVAQEFLLLVEKREVSEELSRIRIHLDALGCLLDSPDPKEGVGKRLEFLLQELHREWTTLGNKIHDAKAGQSIINAKLELEKIREQSLNLA